MDPNACLDRAESALRAAHEHEDSDELDDCYDALTDYDTWIKSGGFAPPGAGKRRAELGAELNSLRDFFPSDNVLGDAPAYQDGPE